MAEWGASELGAAIKDICARGGIDVDTSQLRGMLEGYSLNGVYSVRDALESLRSAYGFNLIERSGELVFVPGESLAAEQIKTADIVLDGRSYARRLLDKRPGELRLTYISSDGTYSPATAQVRDIAGDRGAVVSVSLPIVLGEARAETLAQQLLRQALKGDSAELAVSLEHLGIEPGDSVQICGDGALWRVDEIEDAGLIRGMTLSEFVAPPQSTLISELSGNTPNAVVFGAPELIIIDALEDVPLVAAAGSPWPGSVSIRAGQDAAFMTERAEVSSPASVGLVRSEISAQPIGRWDKASRLEVYVPGAAFSSETEASVLAGANRLLVETAGGWELLAFRTAELIGDDTYVLSDLLRGLRGTVSGSVDVNAHCVIPDGAVEPAVLSAEEIGVELQWQAVSDTIESPLQSETFEARGALAYRPGHLRAAWQGSDLDIRWTRRGKDVPESWLLPEAENAGQFEVILSSDAGDLGAWTTQTANLALTPPSGSKWVKVAEIGPDGRRGAEAVLLIPGASA